MDDSRNSHSQSFILIASILSIFITSFDMIYVTFFLPLYAYSKVFAFFDIAHTSITICARVFTRQFIFPLVS